VTRRVTITVCRCVCAFLLLLCTSAAWGQRAWGFRFAGDFASLAASDLPLAPGTVSNVNLGPYFTQVDRWGGYSIGLYLRYKDVRGGFNLPLVMRDFDDGVNASIGALEADLRVGPRFGWFFPQTGLVAGWRWKATGFASAAAPSSPNRFYAAVPIGLKLRLPTGFGATGIGVHYLISLTNFLSNPDGRSGWAGGAQHRVQVELFVQFDQR